MKQTTKLCSLLLAAALCAGPLCMSAGAEASGGASSTVTPEDASQGAVRQDGDMVTLTQSDGTQVTFTSAYLGGSLSVPDPDPYYNGRVVELKTIIVQPGCIGYAVTPSGEYLTGTEEDREFHSVFCRDFAVYDDGTFGLEGYHDASVLGNTYAIFGADRETWGYSVVLTAFYADDGCYCIVTQEVLDRFCQLTGIQVQGGAQVFADVSPDAWYAPYVQTVYEKGLFSGTGQNTFSPEDGMTYASFLVVLSQFSGETVPASQGAWYQGYVDWAEEKGLIYEEMTSFDPDAPITRQDMAALFESFLSAYPCSAEPVTDAAPDFRDRADIAPYAQAGVELCCLLGIMSGTPDQSFAPLATATRAEVAVTMTNMAQLMGR